MSSSDQERWNERYRAGAYAERGHASDFLVQQESKLLCLAGRTAADIACGRGRNSRYLARLGFRVDAYDVSDVALRFGAQDASLEHAPSVGEIRWHKRDLLAAEFAVESTYDVIIMVRFVAPSLLATLAEKLRPGGLLIVEEHLQYDGPEAVAGPRSQRFRVRSGELVLAVSQLQVLEDFEGLVVDPDGANAAVARLAARREEDG